MGIENIIIPKEMYETVETVPCHICGKQTDCTGTKLCDTCWEVTHRLKSFLAKPNGRKYAEDLIKELVGA
ncbi:MAG: hypothetical protein ABIB11_01970 [Candidatus Omnitrophota bacterium]